MYGNNGGGFIINAGAAAGATAYATGTWEIAAALLLALLGASAFGLSVRHWLLTSPGHESPTDADRDAPR